MDPTFFPTAAAFRAWLEEHHAEEPELLVGFHKKGSGRPTMSWPESVDQALCFGWIDGVRRSLGEEGYTIRFTPRKPRSTWSAINIRRAQELIDEGLMAPAGRAAFERRSAERSAIYAYEQRRAAKLDSGDEREFRANRAAWAFFEEQAPWYRRTAVHWVTSAKREATRRRRLATLIEDSAAGRRLRQLTRPGKRQGARRRGS
jgi:uncharacterized protein YdeI (YjbR/CyaY-like superfamily)